jgi:hypothetical protein
VRKACLALVLATLACNRPSPGAESAAPPLSPTLSPPDGGAREGENPATAPPGPTAAPTPAPTPTAAPAPVPVTAAVVVVGGQEVALARGDVTLVDPGASYRVEVGVHLVDGRLALHDEQDAMVASTGTTEATGSATVYRLTPVEPLRPGSSYTLVVDGAVTREAHDASGAAHAPFVAKLKTTGERPAPPKKRGRPRR